MEQPSPLEPVAPRSKLPYERPLLVTHGDLQHITQTVSFRRTLDGPVTGGDDRTS